MNAVLHDEDQVPVISNDATKAPLNTLRDGLQQVRASQSHLHDKIDKTNERIDKTNEKLDKTNEKIEAVNSSLSARIDTRIDDLKTQMLARFDKQSEEIKAIVKD